MYKNVLPLYLKKRKDMELLTQKYSEKITFTLSCYDRLILKGTLPELSYAQGMTKYLYDNGIKIFDYPHFAEPYKDKINTHIKHLAQEMLVEIEFISKSTIRKESLVSKKLETCGTSPGVVCILSAMEICPTYKPWHNKTTGKTYLRPDQSKCLHYYVYFIDEVLGLGYMRIPTWCPFNLQVYINGHNLLAKELDAHGISYTMLDNSFDSISDPVKAQELSDNLSVEKIHRRLETLTQKFCPMYKEFDLRYHWCVMQAEYSTDIVFKQQKHLQSIYSELVATAIHTVKPENISTFLGRKLSPLYQGEMGNNYNVRIEGSRIKHTMGSTSIKMYDKFSKILRIETTVNDITFFKHYREVVHRDGTKSNQNASLKKNIYSLTFLDEILLAANKRYLEFISAFDNKEVGRKRLSKITESKTVNNRKYKGFNPFDKKDIIVLLAIMRGEFNINGFRNKNLQRLLKLPASKVSRIIKRLLVHGIIKKVNNSYKYYVAKLGKKMIIMTQKIKEIDLIPALSY
jgi:DNA-binding MarR family transcriptional regulator